MSRRRAWFFVGVIVVLPFAVMGGMLGYARWQDGRVMATRADGSRIVAAIARFQWRAGHLPDSLAQLTPDLLPSVPVPRWGTRAWRFRRLDARTACGTTAPAGEGNYFELAACESAACSRALAYNSCRATWTAEGPAVRP